MGSSVDLSRDVEAFGQARCPLARAVAHPEVEIPVEGTHQEEESASVVREEHDLVIRQRVDRDGSLRCAVRPPEAEHSCVARGEEHRGAYRAEVSRIPIRKIHAVREVPELLRRHGRGGVEEPRGEHQREGNRQQDSYPRFWSFSHGASIVSRTRRGASARSDPSGRPASPRRRLPPRRVPPPRHPPRRGRRPRHPSPRGPRRGRPS